VLDTFVTATLEETLKKKQGKGQILRVKLTYLNGRYEVTLKLAGGADP